MTKEISKGFIFKIMKKYLHDASSYTGAIRDSANQYSKMAEEVLMQLVTASLLDPPIRGEYPGYVCHLAVMRPGLIYLLNECYFQLIVRGIIIPAPSPPRLFDSVGGWDSYSITDYGLEWANSDQEPFPEDVWGFLDFIKNIPDIDETMLKYISESLRTFDGGFLLASAVMLGGAAEKLFHLLAEELSQALRDETKKRRLVQKLECRKLSELRDEVQEIFKNLSGDKSVPFAIRDNLGSLLSLFDSIRIQRNDAGHPTVGRIDRPTLYLLLMSFPHVCKRAYDLIGWLKMNQI